MIYALLAANYGAGFSLSGVPQGDIGVILVVIALMATLRIYRGVRGARFSRGRVYRLPAIYLVLTILSLFALNPSYLNVIVVLVSIIAGYMIGLRLAAGLQFFERNDTTYYKRSPFIMIVWLVSFMARLGIEFLYPTNLVLGIVVEVVLAGTTGLVLGEATHIIKGYGRYKNAS